MRIEMIVLVSMVGAMPCILPRARVASLIVEQPSTRPADGARGDRREEIGEETTTVTTGPRLSSSEAAEGLFRKIIGGETALRAAEVELIESASVDIPLAHSTVANKRFYIVRFQGLTLKVNPGGSQVGPFMGEARLDAATGALLRLDLAKEGAAPVARLPDADCFRKQLAANGPEAWDSLLKSEPASTLTSVLSEVNEKRGAILTATHMQIHVVVRTTGEKYKRTEPVWSIFAQGLAEEDLPTRIRETLQSVDPVKREHYRFIRHAVADGQCRWLSSMNHPVPAVLSDP